MISSTKLIHMKLQSILFLLITTFILLGCKSALKHSSREIKEYLPIDETLQNKILSLDAVYFKAYNTCDMDVQSEMYSNNIEFFHDKSGLATLKEEILKGIKRNVFGKVTGTLIEGSVEIYPINNYGAVQISYHKFHNKAEPNAESIPSKFIVMWHNDNNNWKMSKVISLH